MSVKLLLAEAIDTLKRGEEQEHAADQLQTATAKGQTKGRDFARVKRDYSAAYDTYIRGLEMMNYCRRQGIDGKIPELQQFTTQKMTVYMARCDALREKEGNILMAVEQADASSCLDKGGYAIGDVLCTRREEFKKSNPVRFETELTDGAYQVIVKNYDKPGVGAAEMWASVSLDAPRGKPLRVKKLIGPSCAWSRYVGVVNSGKLTVSVVTDAWLRASRVEVIVRALIPTESDDSQAVMTSEQPPTADAMQMLPQGNWVDQLPALPAVPTTVPGASGPPPPPPPQHQHQHPTAYGAPTGYPHPQQHHHHHHHQQQQPYPQQPPPGPGYPPAGPGYPTDGPGYPTSGPGYALPANDGGAPEPMGGFAAPQPDNAPQTSAPAAAAAAPSPAPAAAPREVPPQPKDSAPLPPVPAPAQPAPAPQAAAPAPYVHQQLDIPEDEEAAMGMRIQRLTALVSQSLPSKPTAVPKDLNTAEQALLRDVAAFPDPTPIMDGEADDMDFGDIDLTDFA